MFNIIFCHYVACLGGLMHPNTPPASLQGSRKRKSTASPAAARAHKDCQQQCPGSSDLLGNETTAMVPQAAHAVAAAAAAVQERLPVR